MAFSKFFVRERDPARCLPGTAEPQLGPEKIIFLSLLRRLRTLFARPKLGLGGPREHREFERIVTRDADVMTPPGRAEPELGPENAMFFVTISASKTPIRKAQAGAWRSQEIPRI